MRVMLLDHLGKCVAPFCICILRGFCCTFQAMKFSITPYSGDSPMRPWPALAEKAFCLKDDSRPEETLFYYDSACPQGGDADTQPVFVLIHGLGDEADSWRHLIPLLNSCGCRTLAPDLPGFGRSAAAGKISLEGYADAVLRLVAAAVRPFSGGLGKEGPPVFLAGSSMGALVAETAALKMPELAEGLILVSGSIPGGPKNPGPRALAKILFRRKWYRAYRKNPEGLWDSLFPYYADLDSMPTADKDFLRTRVMARVESTSQERAFFAIQRSLVRAYLFASSRYARKIKRYKGRILLIWGESDRIIPLSSAEGFKALRRDIALEVIPGAGHLPHQERPGDAARLMADFAGK